MASSRDRERAELMCLMCLAAKMALDAENNSLGTHLLLVRVLECTSGHYTKEWCFHIISTNNFTVSLHDRSGPFQP